MSEIPSEIPGFGSAQLAPRANPAFTPGGDITTEDYFVLSRCDGRASAREIILMVGLGNDRGCSIIAKLRRLGAVLLPGETPESVAATAAERREAARARGTTDSPRPRPG